MIQKRTFPCKKWGRQCNQKKESSSKQNRNNRNERPIPLLCGPIIDTTAYESPHSPNLTSFMKFSNPVTLKTPSPSMSCVEKHASAISALQKRNVWSINHHVHNQKWNKKETKTQSTRNIDHCSVLPASSISPNKKSSTKLSLGI